MIGTYILIKNIHLNLIVLFRYLENLWLLEPGFVEIEKKSFKNSEETEQFTLLLNYLFYAQILNTLKKKFVVFLKILRFLI